MRIYIGITLLLVALMSIPVESREVMKIDVMTRAADQADLKTIKLGVLGAFNAVPWVQVKSIGEDYSFWIVGLKREVDATKRTTTVSVLLKPKATIWRNDPPLADRKLTVSFSSSNADRDDLNAIESTVARYIKTGGTSGALATETGEKIANIAGEETTSGAILVGAVLQSLGPHLGRPPEAWELTEATLIGFEALVALHQMIEQQARR